MTAAARLRLRARRALCGGLLATAALAALAGPSGATAAPRAPEWRVYQGFAATRPVFLANGFPGYKATTVRCYSPAGWKQALDGEDLLGFYDGGPWVHVGAETCRQAARVLERTEVTWTTVNALATLFHEAIHRQGIRDESITECLASWLTAHEVLARTGSRTVSIRAFGWARGFTDGLPYEYLTTDGKCAEIAVRYGVKPIDSSLVA